MVFVHNLMALVTGYGPSTAIGPERDRRAITWRDGHPELRPGPDPDLQLLQCLGGMAIVTARWGIWHIVAGLTLATFWKNRHRCPWRPGREPRMSLPNARISSPAPVALGRQLVARLAALPEQRPARIVAHDLRLPETPLSGVEYLACDIRSPDGAKAIARHGINGGRTWRPSCLGQGAHPRLRVRRGCQWHPAVAGGLPRGAAHHSSSGGLWLPRGQRAWLTEDYMPVRGNEVFAYSHHKRLVVELLARVAREHPALEQVVLRDHPGRY